MVLKRAVLHAVNSVGLSMLARRVTSGQLRILCYHGLWVTPGRDFGDCLFISPEQFDRRMARLKQSGRPVLPLCEAVEGLESNNLPEGAVAITIDDGWVSTLTHMLPILEHYGLPATLYATTWYSGRALPVVNVAVRYLVEASGRTGLDSAAETARIESLPYEDRLDALREFGVELGVEEAWLEHRQFHILSAEELAEAHHRGLSVQLHTHRHIEVDETPELIPQEVAMNRTFLEAAIGEVPLHHFCYPSGRYHPKAPSLLRASGVRSATLVDEGLNAPGTDPLALRRFLDARSVSDLEFDAYLSGVLHFLSPLRAISGR